MEEEKGGVVEGGGGLGNAPYRSARRGPPIIGSAWRREGGALRQTPGSLDQVADADTRCTERCEGATGHRDGSPPEKKARKLTSAVKTRGGGTCGALCWMCWRRTAGFVRLVLVN